MNSLFRAKSWRRETWIVLTLAVALVASPGLAFAEIKGPTSTDRDVTLAVTALLRREHLTGHPLDSEITSRCLKLYTKTLDPWKLYFYQSDIDEFNNQQHDMVGQIRRGDVTIGYTIFQRFLQRLDERMKLVDEFVNAPHDFTLDEEMPVVDEIKNPKTPDEARELWRKKIKHDLLVLKAADADPKSKKDTPAEPVLDPKTRLSKRYHSFAKQMQRIDHDELLEMFLTSLTTSYDPHSSYMSPSTLENFEIQMRLKLDGIGAQLQWKDGFTIVNKIVPGGAADKDGRLKAEDKVVGVGQGDEGELVDVVDMKLGDVVKLIRGTRGTNVRLEVIPVGKTERKVYKITRAEIALKDSEAQSEIIEETRDGRVYKIGVINLPSFYMDMEGARRNDPNFKSTTRDVARLLDEFRAKRVDAVILDLSKNGGGSLTEAINLTGLFIDEGPIVQVKDKDNRRQQYSDLERGKSWDGPLVVMTSKFSASASEIFAGAIQDYRRGIIVGDKATHGKGTVQSLLNLGQQLFQLPNSPALGALKITIQQFYRPNGDSTQNRGVRADVALPSLTSELDVGESDLEYALPFDRIDAVDYKAVNMVTPTMVTEMQTRSQARTKDSTDWQKVARNIARYHEQKAKKTITLNEKKYLAERAELNAERELEKELDKADNQANKVVDRNYYFNEVLNVTFDYLNALKYLPAGNVIGQQGR